MVEDDSRKRKAGIREWTGIVSAVELYNLSGDRKKYAKPTFNLLDQNLVEGHCKQRIHLNFSKLVG